jgi:uncharacterized protein YndB with AHSA1/START domain
MTATDARGTAAIERTLELRAGPERVWRALTDAAELGGWFGARGELDLRPGGAGFFEWTEHGRFAARVEAVDPPRHLAWRWAREKDTPVDGGPSTLVEFRLEPLAEGGTRLHLRESGFERPEDRVANSGGWLEELGELAAFLAEHRWEAGIRKTWALASPIERVWAALAEPAQLAVWWSMNPDLVIETAAEGWFTWEGMGRFGCRFEAVEPPHYLCWRWAVVTDVRVEDARPDQVLRTEWVLARREDGGTDLSLLESGFTDDHGFAMNDGGWDGDVVPGLRKHLGEA